MPIQQSLNERSGTRKFHNPYLKKSESVKQAQKFSRPFDKSITANVRKASNVSVTRPEISTSKCSLSKPVSPSPPRKMIDHQKSISSGISHNKNIAKLNQPSNQPRKRKRIPSVKNRLKMEIKKLKREMDRKRMKRPKESTVKDASGVNLKEEIKPEGKPMSDCDDPSSKNHMEKNTVEVKKQLLSHNRHGFGADTSKDKVGSTSLSANKIGKEEIEMPSDANKLQTSRNLVPTSNNVKCKPLNLGMQVSCEQLQQALPQMTVETATINTEVSTYNALVTTEPKVVQNDAPKSDEVKETSCDSCIRVNILEPDISSNEATSKSMVNDDSNTKLNHPDILNSNLDIKSCKRRSSSKIQNSDPCQSLESKREEEISIPPVYCNSPLISSKSTPFLSFESPKIADSLKQGKKCYTTPFTNKKDTGGSQYNSEEPTSISKPHLEGANINLQIPITSTNKQNCHEYRKSTGFLSSKPNENVSIASGIKLGTNDVNDENSEQKISTPFSNVSMNANIVSGEGHTLPSDKATIEFPSSSVKTTESVKNSTQMNPLPQMLKEESDKKSSYLCSLNHDASLSKHSLNFEEERKKAARAFALGLDTSKKSDMKEKQIYPDRNKPFQQCSMFNNDAESISSLSIEKANATRLTFEEERKKAARAFALGLDRPPANFHKLYNNCIKGQNAQSQQFWYPNFLPQPIFHFNPYAPFFPYYTPQYSPPWIPTQQVLHSTHLINPNPNFRPYTKAPLPFEHKGIPPRPLRNRLLLAENPMKPPSPWIKTHAVLESKIYLKKPIGGTFGVSVEYRTRTALVPREQTKNTNDSVAQTNRKPRRKRTPFGVVLVTHTEKQEQYVTDIGEESRVKVDDIILSIQGVELATKEFSEAMKLFSSETLTNQDNKWILCELKVARPKEKKYTHRANKSKAKKEAKVVVSVPRKLPMIPIIIDSKSTSVVSGDFSELETQALVKGMQHAQVMKLVRESYPDHEDIWNIIKSLPESKPVFDRRSTMDLKKKWNFELTLFGRKIEKKAEEHWSGRWSKEISKESNAGKFVGTLSDAKRAQLRSLPRPLRGCKCGSADHERVNHPRCILYRDLKQQHAQQAGNESIRELSRSLALPNQKRAPVIGSMENIRAERARLELEADEREALFVESMEKIQVENGKAVFAPTHLSIMVISSISELNKSCKSRKSTQEKDLSILDDNQTVCIDSSFKGYDKESQLLQKHDGELSDAVDQSAVIKDSDNDNNDDDDDDDVLLNSLKSKESEKQTAEIQRFMKVISALVDQEGSKKKSVTMSEILVYISRTWGHVFEEPDHLEYSWRKNIHKLNSMNHLGRIASFERNPREPGTNSFEKIQFSYLNNFPSDKIVDSNSEDDKILRANKKTESNDTLRKVHITDLISSFKTGLLDEIYFLIHASIIEVSIAGSLTLTENWYENVDPSILNEMHSQWGLLKDPDGKFCISQKVRKKLDDMWTKNENGWVRADTGVLVHDCEVLKGIREKFEANFEIMFDGLKGIGKFGI